MKPKKDKFVRITKKKTHKEIEMLLCQCKLAEQYFIYFLTFN